MSAEIHTNVKIPTKLDIIGYSLLVAIIAIVKNK